MSYESGLRPALHDLACQAGIMFGDNSDIPAYRWYDKSKGKLYVSSTDAAELNARYGHGQGLMRNGSSVMNMMNGDAEKSMFTMANMKTGTPEEQKRRAQDVTLLMLNPYFLCGRWRSSLWETGRELWEAWQAEAQERAAAAQPAGTRLSLSARGHVHAHARHFDERGDSRHDARGAVDLHALPGL